MKDYTLYIAAAYGICFAVLLGLTLATLLARKKVK